MIILILFLVLSWAAINTALAAPTDVSPSPSPSSLSAETGLTAIQGIKVGQHTLSERPTGCTVVLLEAGAVAGVDVRGSSPGTRETALLSPLEQGRKSPRYCPVWRQCVWAGDGNWGHAISG